MSEDYYCEKHDLKEPAYKHSNDAHCPYCREERRIRAERQHMMTRDSRVEPW